MSLSERLYQHELERVRDIVQDPEWYHQLTREQKLRTIGATALHGLVSTEGTIRERLKNGLYDVFEQLLAEEAIKLGAIGQYEWDSERQPVDMIVIHHTSRQPGLSADRLNAMHLIRLYVPHYQNPPESDRPHVAGQPIYSGHFREGKQKFWGYHWLVRDAGQVERLLSDDQTGWQSGDWNVNCRSVAICIDDDLVSKKPDGDIMDGIGELINRHYSHLDISPTTLLGHTEVNMKTSCPGGEFLGGWKFELLDRIGA